MEILSADQMAELDSRTIREKGVSAAKLMETAGGEFVKALKPFIKKTHRLLVLAGAGNNGGDAFVVARRLFKAGYRVQVWLAQDPKTIKGAALKVLGALRKSGVRIRTLDEGLLLSQTDFDALIDGIFGTGLNRAPSGLCAKLITWVNGQGKPVYSIDVPSGFSVQKGRPFKPCLKASHTISFQYPKTGFFNPYYKEYIGTLILRPIGLVPPAQSGMCRVTTRDDFRLPLRERTMHKASQKRVYIVGGSLGKTGAPLLAGLGALRGGGGLVSVLMPDAALQRVRVPRWELMFESMQDDGQGYFGKKQITPVLERLDEKSSLLLLGPGLGSHPDTQAFALQLIREARCPLILDADALNALSSDTSVLKRRKSPFCFLTPHPKELERLTHSSYRQWYLKREDFVRSWSTKLGVPLMVKGAYSLIATPEGCVYVNPTGNPSMANAGQGDFLGGLMAGLMSEAGACVSSARMAVFWHGLIADYLFYSQARRINLASDLSEASELALQWFKTRPDLYRSVFP